MRCKIPERDLVQRLDSTFCRYNGKPYYVRIDIPDINLYEIPTKRPVLTINANDPLFDISSIPLGYVQFNENEVVYLSRTPARIFKQGVSTENLAYHYLNNKIPRGRINVFCKEFVDMINGVYSALDISLAKIQTTNYPHAQQLAVSRDIALSREAGEPIVTVNYKNKQVGWIPPNKNIVIVPSSDQAWIISKYLSELKWEVR